MAQSKMRLVVCDATVLIFLSKINRFTFLKACFDSLHISEMTYDEVVIAGKGLPGSGETQKAIDEGILKKDVVTDSLAVQALSSTLGKGEAETLILAKEKSADAILSDDSKARAIAKSLNLKAIGTIGILIEAMRQGIIRNIQLKAIIDELVSKGYRLKETTYQRILQEHT